MAFLTNTRRRLADLRRRAEEARTAPFQNDEELQRIHAEMERLREEILRPVYGEDWDRTRDGQPVYSVRQHATPEQRERYDALTREFYGRVEALGGLPEGADGIVIEHGQVRFTERRTVMDDLGTWPFLVAGAAGGLPFLIGAAGAGGAGAAGAAATPSAASIPVNALPVALGPGVSVPGLTGAAGAAGAAGATGAAGAAGAAAGRAGGIFGGSALENVLTGLGIAGTALDVWGRLKAGNEAKALAEYNAQIAQLRAQDALQRGAADEERFRMGVRTLIGEQRADFAGQNVDVGIGSAADVQADSAFLGELDALTIRTNAAREAWGYTVAAENIRRGGEAAQTQAQFGAAQSILAGGTSLLAARYGWGRRT